MSQAQIQKFYDVMLNDPGLLGSITKGVDKPEEFIRNAVDAGQQHGYEFTYDEARAWFKEQAENKAGGELSESQLEAVAGGAFSPQSMAVAEEESNPSAARHATMMRIMSNIKA